MTQEALDRYIEIKQEIDELEEELDLIKDKVVQFVSESADGKIETDNYVIRHTSRVSYDFSEEYDARNRELKELRKNEIENGIATEKGSSSYVTLKLK